MKLYLNNPSDDWICSRLYQEWYDYNPQISTKDPSIADIIWVISGWQWRDIDYNILKNKKVVLTVHHIVPNKFDLNEFKTRDTIVDKYHVPCEHTKQQILPYTDKPIFVSPFWGNNKLWYPLKQPECRKELQLPNKMLIGSFQRDTEGSNLRSPKLEKGPDVFCNIVEQWNQENDLEVVLAGWRRQYIINRLDKAGIKYHYFELPDMSTLNKLYNSLDLYLVASRYEGGPQAVVECALSKTPIISTNVGLAPEILSPESIIDNNTTPQPNVEYAYNRAIEYNIPKGFKSFIKTFHEN
jgi:glycosyltransferase involved in cell wall biosynthesis